MVHYHCHHHTYEPPHSDANHEAVQSRLVPPTGMRRRDALRRRRTQRQPLWLCQLVISVLLLVYVVAAVVAPVMARFPHVRRNAPRQTCLECETPAPLSHPRDESCAVLPVLCDGAPPSFKLGHDLSRLVSHRNRNKPDGAIVVVVVVVILWSLERSVPLPSSSSTPYLARVAAAGGDVNPPQTAHNTYTTVEKSSIGCGQYLPHIRWPM